MGLIFLATGLYFFFANTAAAGFGDRVIVERVGKLESCGKGVVSEVVDVQGELGSKGRIELERSKGKIELEKISVKGQVVKIGVELKSQAVRQWWGKVEEEYNCWGASSVYWPS